MRQKYILPIVFLTIALLFGCAKQGMPSGGPKDITPPAQKRMVPENRTMSFEGNQFYIEFDEYVVIKDAENNILVSPPMTQKPEYKTKGRGIQVRINDTLKPNTTYVFQFKDAIADFNEGNLLPTLEYVFSTGTYIDSMTVRGKAVDALTAEAREETMSVWLLTAEQRDLLLRSMTDTSVKAPSPTYATRCDKQGKFSFNHIRPGQYYIIALADEDKNMQIGPYEAVGFVDKPVASHPMVDSVIVDSVMRSKADESLSEIIIYKPDNNKQRLTGSTFTAAGKVRITSQLPLVSPTIESGAEKTLWRLNSKGDTLTLWTLRRECDSLHLIVADPSGIQDTLNLRWRPKKGASATSFQSNVKLNYSKLPYFDTLSLLFSTPLASNEPTDSAARIISMKDSSVAYCTVIPDSSLLKARIDYPFRQNETYSISIAKGTLKNIYNQPIDSLRTNIEVTKADDYGNLKLTMKEDSAAVNGAALIAELLDEKGNVLERHTTETGKKVEFLNIKPGKYRIRVIIDLNGNGKWDGGDFASQRQPEPVRYYRKTLDVRANWDFEEEFIISK